MNLQEICGQRQLTFMQKFDYIREAGTPAELQAAQEIQAELASFGVDSRTEEFEFDSYRILEATLTITEPYEKTYTVAGYGRVGNTPVGCV